MKLLFRKVLATASIFALCTNILGLSGVSAQEKTSVSSNGTNSEASQVESIPEARYLEKPYLVKLKNSTSIDQFTEKYKLKENKKKLVKDGQLLSIQLTEPDVSNISNSDMLEYIEQDASANIASIKNEEANNDKIQNQVDIFPWGEKAIGADLTSKKVKLGDKVKIALLDTGVGHHPDLKLAGGVSFVDNVTDYTDDNGHGTHVAGTIQAQQNNYGIVGVSPDAELFSVKVLNKYGEGSYSSIIDGINWAIKNRIDVISMSFGGHENSQAMHEVIQEARNKGIILVAAAGNNGLGDEKESYPAQYPEVISVGAINDNYVRAPFSNTGEEIDIVAPGTGVLSTIMDGTYGIMSGTSMAVPHVTGSIAVVLANSKKLSSDEIIKKIYESATPLGEATEYGHGLINLPKAIGIINGEVPRVSNEQNNGNEQPQSQSPQQDQDTQINYDLKLSSLSNYLLHLIETAARNGYTEQAKSLQAKYNDLKIINTELHQLPEEIKEIEKKDITAFNNASQLYFISKLQEYKKLENEFMMVGISGLESLGMVSKLKDNSTDVSNQSYNKTGDGQSIVAGNIALVGLYLDTPKSQINITVYPSNNPSNIVASHTYTNSPANTSLAYVWQTTSSTSAGTYTIRWNYPEAPGYDDYFTVYVTQPTPTTSNIYLNSPVDVSLSTGTSKVYSFTPSTSGAYKIFTSAYAGTGGSNDTVLELYSNSSLSTLIASNDDANGTTFSEVKTTLNAGMTYYIKIRHYSSTGAVYARLAVTTDVPAPTLINLNAPVDINMPAGSSKVYKFTPTTSATYRIITGYYNGSSSSGSNDTLLYVYSDVNLTNQLGYNDDSNGTTFSQIDLSMNAGVSYYIKIAGYNGGLINARLTVTTPPITFVNLTENNPIDVQLGQGLSQSYQFTAPVTGPYLISTSPYAGTASGSNDTTLTLYSNSTMTTQLAYDNDSNGGGYSTISTSLTAGVTYYLRLSPYSSSSSVQARLTVLNDHGNDISSAFNIQLNTTNSAKFNLAGDVDVFQFVPLSNGVYKFQTLGTTDTVIELYNSSEALFEMNDDYGGSLTSSITTQLFSNNKYYLKVYHYDTGATGAYSLIVSQVEDVVSGESISLTPLTRLINYPGDEDLFYFTPTVTRTYTVKTSGTLDTLGVLQDSGDNILGHSDDISSTDSNFSISYNFIAGQTYKIRVRAYNANVTDYSYTISIQ